VNPVFVFGKFVRLLAYWNFRSGHVFLASPIARNTRLSKGRAIALISAKRELAMGYEEKIEYWGNK
jgi:hypothetical protein